MKEKRILRQKYYSALITGLLVILLVILVMSSCFGMEDDLEKNLKAKWYEEALRMLQTNYTKIKIAIVYHEKWQNDDGSWSDLRINSSPEALQAYRKGVSSNYFIGKERLPLQGQPIYPPEYGCYVGVFPGWGEFEDSVSISELADFESLSGKSVAFVPFSVFFDEYISKKNLDKIQDNLNSISSYGAIPLVRLMPWGEPYWEPGYQPDYALQKIIDGDFDLFLSDLADCIKAYNEPVMMTFSPEMNGDWFPWSGVFQGGSVTDGYGDPEKADGPERYADAFRHIVTLFRDRGVDNVIWYFHVNHESYPDEGWNSIEAYYPGDEYVDWVGFSLYGAQTKDDPWIGFENAMEPIYNELTSKFPNKPLMLCEWGVMER